MTTLLCPGCGSALAAPRCEGCRAAGRRFGLRKHKSASTKRHNRERRLAWLARRRAQRAPTASQPQETA